MINLYFRNSNLKPEIINGELENDSYDVHLPCDSYKNGSYEDGVCFLIFKNKSVWSLKNRYSGSVGLQETEFFFELRSIKLAQTDYTHRFVGNFNYTSFYKQLLQNCYEVASYF